MHDRRVGGFIENNIIQKDGIYYVDPNIKFNYNDGDRAENDIFYIITNTSDICSQSRELEKFIRDWPTLYHFSRERTLAYHSLTISHSAAVLEVGSGCGSITRLLGERAGYVLALEGSPRRAAITRARTRDLENVDVLCASFADVKFTGHFDLIVCNGVLEYAALFVEGERPHEEMIKKLSGLLAPGGSLVIAIENQFGLRYFSSGKEEHTGLMFEGLEGYKRAPEGVRTFGHGELRAMLQKHLRHVETLLPLPDYKMPTAIVRSELLSHVNCAELFANTARHDFGTHVVPALHERLVWRELARNCLLCDHANSFFIICSNCKSALFDESWLGDIYSIRRRPEWTVRTRLTLADDGKVNARKERFEPEVPPPTEVPFAHALGSKTWAAGISVHTAVVDALCRSSAKRGAEELREGIRAWWKQITALEPNQQWVSGAALDHNWQNTILGGDGAHFIDDEWIWNTRIDPAWLIYRTAAKFIGEEIFFAHRWNKRYQFLSVYGLCKLISREVGAKVTISHLLKAIRQERDLQFMVSGRETNTMKLALSMFEPIVIRQKRKSLGRWVGRIRDKILRILNSK